MKRKLMILGASKNQILPICYARRQGYYIVACDQNPQSVARGEADEFHAISTSDFEGLVKIAKKADLDGVMTYSSDPSAPGVAYVGNALGLPSNPFPSVDILTQKDKFRRFLKENNFTVPRFCGYENVEAALADIKHFRLPVMVKPCDCSGSRGVTKLTEGGNLQERLSQAFELALSYSNQKRVVIEEFFQRQGYQVAGDGFVVDGKLVFRCFANEHFNATHDSLVPIGESFPSAWDPKMQDRAHQELQRLFTLLGIKMGAFNFDFMMTDRNEIFLIEIGPRNGGNLIPQVIQHATGVDLLDYTVKAAMGEDCSSLKMQDVKGFYSSYMFHSDHDGIFKGINLNGLQKNVVEHSLDIEPGAKVESYHFGGNRAFGSMILCYESMEEMLHKMDHMTEFLDVKVEGSGGR